MPKELTHFMLGEHFLRRCNGVDPSTGYKYTIEVSPFYLGTVLPDAFFYDVPLFKRRYIAKHIHREKGENLFRIVVQELEKCKEDSPWNNRIFSLCLGLLNHLAADMIWHPLVVQCCESCPRLPKSPLCEKSLACHFRLESVLDIIMSGALGIPLESLNFPQRVCLLKNGTRALLSRFCTALQESANSRMQLGKCNGSSALKCLVTQATALSLFRNSPLYWVSYAADTLTFKVFDTYQALFYPPKQILKNRILIKLTPGVTYLFNQKEAIFRELAEKTIALAMKLAKIALEEKSGKIDADEAYDRFMALSLPSGIDGHLNHKISHGKV